MKTNLTLLILLASLTAWGAGQPYVGTNPVVTVPQLNSASNVLRSSFTADINTSSNSLITQFTTWTNNLSEFWEANLISTNNAILATVDTRLNNGSNVLRTSFTADINSSSNSLVTQFSGGGGGEVGSATNIGIAGVGVFTLKSNVVFMFKTFNATQFATNGDTLSLKAGATASNLVTYGQANPFLATDRVLMSDGASPPNITNHQFITSQNLGTLSNQTLNINLEFGLRETLTGSQGKHDSLSNYFGGPLFLATDISNIDFIKKKQVLTQTVNRTYTFSNTNDGNGTLLIIKTPSAVDVIWPSGIEWIGGVAPTNNLSGTNAFTFIAGDGEIYGFYDGTVGGVVSGGSSTGPFTNLSVYSDGSASALTVYDGINFGGSSNTVFHNYANAYSALSNNGVNVFYVDEDNFTVSKMLFAMNGLIIDNGAMSNPVQLSSPSSMMLEINSNVTVHGSVVLANAQPAGTPTNALATISNVVQLIALSGGGGAATNSIANNNGSGTNLTLYPSDTSAVLLTIRPMAGSVAPLLSLKNTNGADLVMISSNGVYTGPSISLSGLLEVGGAGSFIGGVSAAAFGFPSSGYLTSADEGSIEFESVGVVKVTDTNNMVGRVRASFNVESNVTYKTYYLTNFSQATNFVPDFAYSEVDIPTNNIGINIYIPHTTNWPAGAKGFLAWNIYTGVTNRHLIIGAPSGLQYLMGTNVAVANVMLLSNSVHRVMFVSHNGANAGVRASYPVGTIWP